MTAPAASGPRLGLAVNAAQLTLLVAVNALVGGVLGSERTVLTPLAEREFHLDGYTAALTCILAFGITEAATNFFAGTPSDRYGRKPVLLAGWLAAIPIPAMLIWAPNWGWIIAANVLLGIDQGLSWSTTVIMKIDLAGPQRRGLAMGLNEAAGYLAVATTVMATGALAAQHGLRPAPFLPTAAYVTLGLGLSLFFVRETRGDPARVELRRRPPPLAGPRRRRLPPLSRRAASPPAPCSPGSSPPSPPRPGCSSRPACTKPTPATARTTPRHDSSPSSRGATRILLTIRIPLGVSWTPWW